MAGKSPRKSEAARRANQVVERAGRDLTAETRRLFYEALESIAANLRDIDKEGDLP